MKNLSTPASHDDIMYAIGEIIREHRRKQGLTQIDLATEIGASPSTIKRIENGVSVQFAHVVDALLFLHLLPREKPRLTETMNLAFDMIPFVIDKLKN